MRYHDPDDQPYIVIEKHSGGVGNLLLGVVIGAGVALLFAPRSGEETRDDIRRRARRAGDAARNVAEGVSDSVADTFETARSRVEQQLQSARSAIELKKRQVTRAMDAGRVAAQEARGDLERRLAETKAAYNAGVEVARESHAGATGQTSAGRASGA
ncbi:MAG TPA: YtxH domain-containing protein [Gemmatimonadaceae bacterium]|nr:YtxH domain-containing protein [Gemmatimonadaceae bacterium]